MVMEMNKMVHKRTHVRGKQVIAQNQSLSMKVYPWGTKLSLHSGVLMQTAMDTMIVLNH